MAYRHAIDATSHVFADLRDLLAKATPPRSGDRLAGIAAESAQQMMAARMALADVPLKQFLQEAVIAYEQVGGNIVVVEQVPDSETHKYGIVAIESTGGRLSRMTGMVEKPPRGTAPSNLIVSGRYILQPEIFDMLGAHEKGAGGEIQLTDAMIKLMASQDFHALEYDGVTYDCGDKIGLLRANVAFGLRHPEFGAAAREAVAALLK